ncbi:MAG TPA: hypothetical protein VLW50_07330 [Streptosporangiaceae bacterium]|nr:hypothetical protein [Streptosporangiaceae bacterium]
MPASAGPPYHAITPPASATCQSDLCRSVAVVRLVVPRPQFTADGLHDDDGAPATWDVCDVHWPRFRDTCARAGHEVIDRTGDLQRVAAEFPRWNLWRSDGGRLYASARVGGTAQGTTVDAYLVGQLRVAMRSAENGQELNH